MCEYACMHKREKPLKKKKKVCTSEFEKADISSCPVTIKCFCYRPGIPRALFPHSQVSSVPIKVARASSCPSFTNFQSIKGPTTT